MDPDVATTTTMLVMHEQNEGKKNEEADEEADDENLPFFERAVKKAKAVAAKLTAMKEGKEGGRHGSVLLTLSGPIYPPPLTLPLNFLQT